MRALFNRTNLLIVAIALFGAAAGFLAGGWLRAPQSAVDGPGPGLRVGDAAVPFTRPDPAGKAHALDEWRGRLLLINFWASWCGPCREEMPLLDRFQQRYAGKGLQVVGIAADSVEATRDFLAQSPVGYPILVDDPALGGDVSRDYGNRMNVLPYTVLVGSDGKILAQRAGNFTEATLERWLQPHFP